MERLTPVLLATSLLLLAACAARLTGTPVPAALEPAGQRLTERVAAKGVQVYQCRVAAGAPGGAQWAFVAPEAELLDARGVITGTHYAGPHWEARDGSKIVGSVTARAEAPRADAIPWLLLSTRSVGGPGRFANVTAVQRIHTVGGLAPSRPCDSAAIGSTERVPYTADYLLYAS
jgi:hypothetical protein